MREQEQRPLGELQKVQVKINHALEKVGRISQTIGTRDFEGLSNLNERFDLSRFSGEEFLDTADRVGKVIEALKERAKPKLFLQKEKVEREIGNFKRIKKAQEQVERINEFVKKGYLPKSALEEAERALANLTQSFTPPSISAEEQRPVIVGRLGRNKIEARSLTLPDGQVIYNLTPSESVMIAKLLGFSKENPIASSEMARFLYGDKIPIDVVKDRLSVLIVAVRKKLVGVGWKVDKEFRRVVGTTRRAEAWYYLAGEEKAEEKQPEGSKETPLEPITEEPRELVLPDGEVLSNLTDPEFLLVTKLLGSSKENSITRSELALFLYGDKVPIKDRLTGVFVTLFWGRAKLQKVGWRVVSDNFRFDEDTGESEIWYYLAPTEKDAEGAEDKTVKKEEVKEIKEDLELPDRRKLTNLRSKEKAIIEGLLCGSYKQPVTVSELAELVYGDSVTKDVAVHRIYSNMVRVKKKLDSVGWEIVNLTLAIDRLKGKEALYYLAQKEDEEKVPTFTEPAGAPSAQEPEEVKTPVVELVSPEASKPSEDTSLTPVEVKKLGEEITIIPYTPTKEERRTQEETRILDVITSSLLSETRMLFEQIQAQLFSGERTKPLVGGEAVFIYQVEELIEGFNSAFRKIREEAAIGALRETWDDKEKEMWNKLELLRTKFQVTEVRDFLRRVSEEITRSERRFYTNYPPEKGNSVTWVRKDNNR